MKPENPKTPEKPCFGAKRFLMGGGGPAATRAKSTPSIPEPPLGLVVSDDENDKEPHHKKLRFPQLEKAERVQVRSSDDLVKHQTNDSTVLLVWLCIVALGKRVETKTHDCCIQYAPVLTKISASVHFTERFRNMHPKLSEGTRM